MMISTELHVVAAIIKDSEGRYLCALRSKSMSHPGVWEFPGGKIKADESPEQALARELREELDVEIKTAIFYTTTKTWNKHHNSTIHLHFYHTILKEQQTPTPHEHAQLCWLESEYLTSLIWAEADQAVIKQLTYNAKTN